MTTALSASSLLDIHTQRIHNTLLIESYFDLLLFPKTEECFDVVQFIADLEATTSPNFTINIGCGPSDISFLKDTAYISEINLPSSSPLKKIFETPTRYSNEWICTNHEEYCQGTRRRFATTHACRMYIHTLERTPSERRIHLCNS